MKTCPKCLGRGKMPTAVEVQALRHGRSIRECSRIAGISPTYLCDALNGRRDVTWAMFDALSRRLGPIEPQGEGE